MKHTLNYTMVSRTVDKLSKSDAVTQHQLTLTLVAIQSAERQFPFSKILDVSYKPFSNGNGFLYIHTDEGVFSFHTDEQPTSFIEAYKKITKHNIKEKNSNE